MWNKTAGLGMEKDFLRTLLQNLKLIAGRGTFTKSNGKRNYLAKELGSRRITANVVAPGAIETDFCGGMVRDNHEINKRVAGISQIYRRVRQAAVPELSVTPVPLPGKKLTLSVTRSISTLPLITKLLYVPGTGA